MMLRPTSLVLLPARRAGRARFCEGVRPRYVLRALGAPLKSFARPCIRRTWAKVGPSFDSFECVDDPLLGGGHAGGAAVRRRRRKEAEALQTLVATVQVLTKALSDLQSSFARMGGKLPPSAPAVAPRKPKAQRRPKGNKPRAPDGPPPPPAPAPARQEPAADTFAAVVRAGLKNKPPAPPTVPFRLAPQGWDCRIRTVSNLRDPLDGPCVIPVYTQQALDEVKSWASATPPGQPVTCVDFVTASPASTVLVLLPRALGPSTKKATLHDLSGPSNPGPQPRKLAAAPELDDKAESGEESQKLEWANFRLTLASEFCEAERFAAGKAKPQALPALLLPTEVVSLIIRTFAVTTYDSELTCLFRVRKKDADAVHSCAKALPAGAFLAPQRSQAYTVTWLKRPADQSSSQYLQLAKDSLAKASGQSCLAYRPGGRANLGIRGLADAAKALAAPDAGAIAPRWVLSGAPTSWVTADASAWLAGHGFKEAAGVSRVGSTSWCFNAWSGHADLGPKTFTSGITVAPAKGRSRKRTAKATVTQSVWGAAPLASSAPAPAAKSAATAAATAAPATGPAVTSEAEVRERSRSPPPAKEAVSQPVLPRPAMPHASSFSPVETGGDGDCAYTSVATGLSQMSGTDATEADLKPGGRLQGFLRCEAAKWIRGHPDIYGGSDAASQFATRVATTGVWADTPSLYALAKALKVQLRVYSFAPAANLWKLYIIGDAPTPKKNRDGKLKKGAQPSVLWLEHADQHYRWLKPKGTDAVLEKAVPSTATTVDASSMPMSLIGGAKRRRTSSPRRPLGLRSADSSGKCTARKLLGLGTASTASPAPAELLGLTAVSEENQAYSAGQLYNCACGWEVPAGMRGNRAHAAAVAHWRQCKGTRPPTASSQNVRRRVALRSVAASEPRRERAWQAFQAHLSKLKGAKWEDAACTPIRDLASTKVSPAGTPATVYPCSKCDRVQTLTRLKSLPCPARDPKYKVTRHGWIAKTVGLEAASHFNSLERLGHNRFAASAKGKLAQKRANASRKKSQHE